MSQHQSHYLPRTPWYISTTASSCHTSAARRNEVETKCPRLLRLTSSPGFVANPCDVKSPVTRNLRPLSRTRRTAGTRSHPTVVIHLPTLSIEPTHYACSGASPIDTTSIVLICPTSVVGEASSMMTSRNCPAWRGFPSKTTIRSHVVRPVI